MPNLSALNLMKVRNSNHWAFNKDVALEVYIRSSNLTCVNQKTSDPDLSLSCFTTLCEIVLSYNWTNSPTDFSHRYEIKKWKEIFLSCQSNFNQLIAKHFAHHTEDMLPLHGITRCSDNGLAPNRRQTIIWLNGGLIHWHIYVHRSGPVS